MYNSLNENGNYVKYIRKSRADLELERIKKLDTLKQHEKFLDKRANDLGIKTIETFKEVVSGESIQDRPQMQKLLSLIESGSIDGVLVVDVDRLSRGDTKDQGIITQTFKYTNTKIITLNRIFDPNNDDDEEYFEFGLFMSRREYKSINRRMQRARIANVLEGKYCASVAPFGYKKVKVQYGKGFTLEPIKEEADILKQVYIKRANKIGWDMICNWLNSLGIKPRKSDVWVPSTVKDMIENPVYLGKIRWFYSKMEKKIINGEMVKKRRKSKENEVIIVEGLHPAIIDEVLFKSANNVEQKKVCTRNSLETKNPIAGLVKCKDCGRILQRRPYYNIYQHKNLKRKYEINKTELRTYLREYKEQSRLSLNDIAKELNISFEIVSHWFANSDNRFTIPKANLWYELKKLLNIYDNKYDKELTEFYNIEELPHEDTLICPKSHCTNVGSNIKLVEDAIIKKIKEYLNQQEKILLSYNTEKENKEDLELITLKNELDKNNAQLQKSYEFVEQGIYSTTEFTNRTKIIKDRIQILKRKINAKENNKQNTELKKYLPKVKKAIDKYYSIKNIEDKNKLLKSIISHIDYKKEKGGKGYENNFSLDIHFKI